MTTVTIGGSAFASPSGACRVGEQGVTGLRGLTVKAQDSDLAHDDGAVSGVDYAGPRMVVIDLLMLGDDEADVDAVCAAREALWQPSAADQTLVVVRGSVSKSVSGRPRDFIVDDRHAVRGVIRAVASFFCGDPGVS